MASLSAPEILHAPARLIQGRRVRMSMLVNRSAELWQAFRALLPAVTGRVGSDFVSVQIYDSPDYFMSFDPAREFERWAAVEVSEVDNLPAGLETLTLPAGLYAMFVYNGSVREFAPFAQQIFATWLPQSPYRLDHRPHFDILGADYRPDDPNAREQIWVPVSAKQA